MKKFLIFILCIASASQLYAAAGLEAFPVAGVEKRKAKKHKERATQELAQPAAHSDDENYVPFDVGAYAFSQANVLAVCTALRLPYIPGLENNLQKCGESSCLVTRQEFKNGRIIDRSYRVSLVGALASVAYSSPKHMEPKLQVFVHTAITECSQDGLKELDSIKEHLDALHAERLISFSTAIYLKACPQIVYGALQMYPGFREQFEKDLPALMAPANRVERDDLARRLRILEDRSENYMKHLQGLPSIGGLGRLSDCGFN